MDFLRIMFLMSKDLGFGFVIDLLLLVGLLLVCLWLGYFGLRMGLCLKRLLVDFVFVI